MSSVMSKYEDRTDPWDVKARRHRRENHDHRNGICELLAGPDRVASWATGECYLTVDWYDPEMRCSCEMCSSGMRELGRKNRRAGKKYARDWYKEY